MLSRMLLTLGAAVALGLAPASTALSNDQNETRGLGGATASAHAISGTRRALVVGISRYENLPASQQLDYADDDAEMVYAFLRSPAGGSTEQAVLLLDEQARAATIVQELTRLRDAAQSGDEIIFYFAGHGDVERAVESAPGLLLGYDAPASGLYVANGGSIPLTFVREIMKEIVDKGARVIILTDACRAGSVNTSLESGAQLTSGALAREWQNVFRFVSSDADTLSEEDPELGHGVFTYYLLKGLLGEADGSMPGAEKDDQISHREIDRYVTDQVYTRTGGGQTPVLSGNPGRPLSVVTPGVTWATLERFVPARSEVEAQQYAVDRGLTTEQREARLESLTPEQRALIEGFTAVLQSGRLVGAGGAVELYETMRGRIPNNYFIQHGDNLATALENQVQALFSEHLSGEMRSDASGSGNGDSLWVVASEEIEAAAEAMQAAVELRGATYATYPSMRSRLQFLRGWGAVVEGDYGEAVQLLDNVSPQSAFSLNAMGYAHYRNGEMDQAAEALARSAELAPNWAEPVRYQGFVAQYRADYEAALAFYRKAAGISPDNPFLQIDIGEVHALSDDTEAAMAAWRRALDIDAERSARTIANFIRGWRTADRDELAESIYADALMRDRNSASLYVDRGDFYRMTARYDDAEEDYNEALRIDPDYESAHNALGLLYESQERYDEAAAAYGRTAELIPDSAVPWRNRADIYRIQERYDEAIADYERALENDPEFYGAHYGLGRTYQALDDLGKAEEYLRLYAEYADSGGAWNDLGVFYELTLKQFGDATRAYERGIAADPEDPLLHANLGDARRKMGQLYEAAGAYRRALSYDPSQSVAISGLERLEDQNIVPRRSRTVEEISGRLDPSTAMEFGDGSLLTMHEVYGEEGEEWTILLRSDAFDPWLFVYDGEVEIADDDDDGPGLDASLTVTLPRSGSYTLIVNTYSGGEYGNYEIVMLREQPEGQDFGEAQVFTGELTRRSEVLDDGKRYDVHYINADAGERLEVIAASDAFDTLLFVFRGDDLIAQDDDSADNRNSRVVMTAPVSGEYVLAVTSYEADSLGQYWLAVRRGIGGAAAAPAAGDPEVAYGTLGASSARLDTDNTPYAAHDLAADVGETYEITMESSDFDTFLILFDPAGNNILRDDDSAGGTNSRITFTAQTAGTYTIYANSYREDASGSYTLTVRRGTGSGGGAIGGGTPGGGGVDESFGASLDINDVVMGELTRANERIDDGPYFAMHTVSADAGETLTFSLSSAEFDTTIYITNSDGDLLGSDDDSGGGVNGTDSQVTVTTATSGDLIVFASGYDASDLGTYTLTVERGQPQDRL
ncbi:MAG: tetratricopeptide repeat protein [Woeseiaceae bacterium]|nr:tetratricopeptide repeat protein [Woeseiaceae bacterium]